MSRPSRIAVGSIDLLETNTFVPALSMRADTPHPIARSGDVLLACAVGTDDGLDRIYDAAEGYADILPMLFATAILSGPVDAGACPTLCNGMATQSLPSAFIKSQGMREFLVRSSEHDPATAGEIAAEDIRTPRFSSSRCQTLAPAHGFMSATEADRPHV